MFLTRACTPANNHSSLNHQVSSLSVQSVCLINTDAIVATALPNILFIFYLVWTVGQIKYSYLAKTEQQKVQSIQTIVNCGVRISCISICLPQIHIVAWRVNYSNSIWIQPNNRINYSYSAKYYNALLCTGCVLDPDYYSTNSHSIKKTNSDLM